MGSGIAVILNKTNNKVFVFYSKNIGKKINYYKKRLREGKFRNDKLQEDWNKIGKDYFDFIILEKHEYNSLIYHRYKEYLHQYPNNYNANRNKTKSGIAAIVNKKNNRKFYTYAKNLYKQKQRLRTKLENNALKNKELQNDWNKLNEDDFEFIIIELIKGRLNFLKEKRYEYVKKDLNSYNKD